MRLALDAEAALVYDEPDPWFVPVRESLGAALLRDHDYREAEQVFRADLTQHPGNLRSLLGLSESLRTRGQLKAARAARAEFDHARKDADVSVRVGDM
jgi:Flp pilus assembly protein TadD